ncbi:MAG: molybdate ABC transporter substrate-binding protein [Chloroflexi bacterium]|nr:molybdate ABC transporter substrate-binding protein [Chloroflexota bacterium]
MRIRVFLPALLALSLAVWNGGAQDQQRTSLTIYAATSLTDVFEEIRDAFAKVNPDVEVLLNFASSSTLAAQLSAGAPADIFASANELQMENVVKAGRVKEEDVETFAHNRLALIVPADNPANVDTFEELAENGVLLVLAAPGTPIRAYTDAMLTSYNVERGEDFRARVLANLVSEESNVRQVVARVALGEADAGVVYQSDALGDIVDRVITIPIAERHNQLASYPIAPLTDAANPGLAESFLRFIRSEKARGFLAAHGFCWPAILDDIEPTEAPPATAAKSRDEDDAPEVECEAATIKDG